MVRCRFKRHDYASDGQDMPHTLINGKALGMSENIVECFTDTTSNTFAPDGMVARTFSSVIHGAKMCHSFPHIYLSLFISYTLQEVGTFFLPH